MFVTRIIKQQFKFWQERQDVAMRDEHDKMVSSVEGWDD